MKSRKYMFLLPKKLRPALGKDGRTEADQGLSVRPNVYSTDFPRPLASLRNSEDQPSTFHCVPRRERSGAHGGN